ncbi:MAG: ABC transporter ATP-binding protein [Flavobacteriales bacterium]|nr:ABC transporter ATP-binding protein [Flavobacteriales bacterium]
MKAIEAIGLTKTYFLEGKNASEFHALKDASFNIEEGESLGIIGRNGAGKSTLLKLLAGITLPSSGNAMIRGSFSSLLEVGTGFHPDLSGRDNIFLNASILGISRKYVSREMENIISFSGVDAFVDQPLRTYSSGMKLRLAFSVIAHLQTDIIALDEVLAVGDSMFQLKCMDRIFDFKHRGKTILFVSHNLSAVKKLCERTLVLKDGEIVFDGKTEEAIQHYLSKDLNLHSELTSEYLKISKVHCTPEQASLNLNITNLSSDNELDLGVNISTNEGSELYHFSNRFIDASLKPRSGKLNLKLNFKHQLKPGNYSISIYLGQNEVQLEWCENALRLVVPPYNPHGFHNPDAIQSPVITDFDIIEN